MKYVLSKQCVSHTPVSRVSLIKLPFNCYVVDELTSYNVLAIKDNDNESSAYEIELNQLANPHG